MNVFLSGAAGFLGRNFLKHHLDRGDLVVAVDDLSSTGAKWLGGTYWQHTTDIRKYMAENQDVTFDIGYMLAAPVGGRLKIEGDPLYNAGSLELDSAFFRWAVGKVTTVVYPSSSAVYGVGLQTAGGAALAEWMFDPREDLWGRPDEMYGFTKMAGEVLALKAAQYGLNTLCIRPFSGYGGDQSLDYPIPSICRRARDREDPLTIWGSGSQTRDFIHVDDIVGATNALLERGIEGYQAVNLGSGTATSFFDVAILASQIMGYDPNIETDESKPQGVSSRYCDPTLMREVYQPKVSLLKGLTRIIEGGT